MASLGPSSTIFSPSVARAAASTAKDWAYVDSWLATHFAHLNRKPPAIERNDATLSALLTLASTNEAADDARDILVSLDAHALDSVRKADADRARRRTERDADTKSAVQGDILSDDLLDSLDASLPREARTALDSLADVSLSLDLKRPSPISEAISHAFVDLQARSLEVDQAIARVSLLESYLASENVRLAKLTKELEQGDEYQLEPDMAHQYLHLQRDSQRMDAKLPELRRQVVKLEKNVGVPRLTVGDVRKDEEVYLDLLSRKKDLDLQLKAFAGLPPDIEAARVELGALRTKLSHETERRDADFERLVERATPIKPRRP
ncbi:hypothetical protein F5Y15DRAFT_410345 [Xylariaceae sp. FL0016]|nr:hypothetical protein F5Y15DRAFT_410345 [Xylariaceae sp. FL0016]